MVTIVADQMIETLAAAGVKRVYGIGGDSLNGFTDALRRHGGIAWMHVRHEEVAAGAEAHLTASSRSAPAAAAVRSKGRRRFWPLAVSAQGLFREHPQLELQADAAECVAGAVAEHDNMMLAIVEELTRPFQRLVFGLEYFGPRDFFIAPFFDRDRHPVIIRQSISHARVSSECLPAARKRSFRTF